MILGLGVDIVEIDRMRHMIDTSGERLIKRIFRVTPNQLIIQTRLAAAARFLAEWILARSAHALARDHCSGMTADGMGTPDAVSKQAELGKTTESCSALHALSSERFQSCW